MPMPQEHIYTSEDYWNLPEGQRAELIDGKLYAMAPPNRIHQRLVHQLDKLIGNYIDSNHGACEVYPAPFAVNLTANDKAWVEPDISIICDSKKLDEKGYHGAPDWIIEILSPSTIRMDCGIKLFKYRTAGVREYWTVNPKIRTVNVYDFEHDEKTDQYTFDDEIPVCIYEDLVIRIADLL